MTGLQPPPALTGFPTRPRSRSPRRLYRIHWHRNRAGALNAAWHFTSIPPGKNRFDLPAPTGTCYWSDRAYGAFVEVFRGIKVLAPSDLQRRRIFTAAAPPLRLGDATAAAAYSFGVTVELSSITAYQLPQTWAKAVVDHGLDGLISWCRHDPTARARNVAVFGPEGRPARRAGWTVTRTRIDSDPQLVSDLRRLGVRTVPIPFALPAVDP